MEISDTDAVRLCFRHFFEYKHIRRRSWNCQYFFVQRNVCTEKVLFRDVPTYFVTVSAFFARKTLFLLPEVETYQIKLRKIAPNGFKTNIFPRILIFIKALYLPNINKNTLLQRARYW